MSRRAEEVARAVLYEGYILYPYRPSSVKNQQRFNFGVVYPPVSSDGAATIQTQCLTMVTSGGAELDIEVRFLHLLARTVVELDEPSFELPAGSEPRTHPVEKVEAGGNLYQSWQEGVEREVNLTGCTVKELARRPVRREFCFAASRAVEPIRDTSGRIGWLVRREQERISGIVEVSAGPAGVDLFRITVLLRNLTENPSAKTRDGALLRSLVSAHKILTVRGGNFISLIDPPDFCRVAADECENAGTFPVLAGEEGTLDVMLSSPIILYDYPQIAPESAGDLFDGTEIDEILSLRILTLTDEEKREMRQSDERGRRILDRIETLPEEQWMKLHGILRGLRPAPREGVQP
jgi:hydrogenase maturation protease